MKDLRDELWEGRPYGRVIEYHISTKVARVIADNLYFANGVHLSDDEKHLFVAETLASRVSRINLATGEKTLFMGTHFTDNISPGPLPKVGKVLR